MLTRQKKMPFPALRAVLFQLLGLLLMRAALGALLRRLFPQGVGMELYYSLSAVQEILLFALPYLLIMRVYSGAYGAVRRCPLRPVEAIGIALAAVLGIFPLAYLSNIWAALMRAMRIPLALSPVPAPQNMTQLLLALSSMAVIPAVCEEWFFRGALFAAAEPRGTVRALVLSSLLFAFMHGQLYALPVHLLLGLVFGALMVLTRSIYAAMIYHAFHNGASLVAAYLAVGAAQEAGAALSAAELWGMLPGMAFLLVVWAALLFLTVRARALAPDNPYVSYALPRADFPMRTGEKVLLTIISLLLAAGYILNTWGGLLP